MTEKTVQRIVAKAITATEINPTKYYHICWWENRLQCLHVHHTKDIHPAFLSVPGETLMGGLNPHQWQLITTRFMDFCRTRNITPDGRSLQRKKRTRGKPRQKKFQITEFDSWRLRTLLASSKTSGGATDPWLDQLQQLLESADMVAPEKVPDNVVTMNSRVRLRDDRDDKEMSVSLVFPADAACDADFQMLKVSVLTPIGLSILGRRVGDAVEGHVHVDELLYQPEAAGDFDL